MLITALYDKEAGKFVQFIPTLNLSVLKRDFKNVMKPGQLYHESAEDFEVYQLGEFDEKSGLALSTEKILAFELSSIKNDSQVQ